MRISDVVIYEVTGRYNGPEFPPGDRQAKQADVYPEFNRQEAPAAPVAGQTVTAFYVEVQTDEGVNGLYGPIYEQQAYFILYELRPILLGQDALATEQRNDQMLRLDRHGRSGAQITASSAVDCALWDLKGKAWGQPVYRLLGGPTRERVPAYASMLGFSLEPEVAAAMAAEYRDKGYSAQKWFFRYGPGDGDAGMAKNLAMAQAVREAVGPDYTLMFDAFMGWSTSYAVVMAQRLAPLRPLWLEEPIPPERVGALRKIRERGGVAVATGEHVYTRWQTKELLVQEAVDFLQNDPDWTGGISELVKVCALASAFEVPVVAHGHSLLPALHNAAAQSPTTVPYVEYLIRNQEVKQCLQKTVYRPEKGTIAVPDAPGLGIELDMDKIERMEPVSIGVARSG
ncbi:MAG: enolase C-terminal domain-like protein [Chloroflexota bacterium]|nr:enolase C-terminal domain-like protein [Chloroflexota bacterium]